MAHKPTILLLRTERLTRALFAGVENSTATLNFWTMQNNIIFLDTETTGKGPEDRLLQLAYKFPDERAGVEVKFKPPLPISFEAMATHHITEKMVADATPFADSPVKGEMQAFLDNCIMVAHNAIFDKEMLEREGLTVPRYICTLKVVQALFDEPSYKLQVLRYKYNLDIEATAHDALGDVLVLEKLFSGLVNGFYGTPYFKDPIAEMLEITQRPVLLRRIGFGKHKGTAFSDIPKDYLAWLAKQPENDPDLVYTLNYYLKPAAETQPTLGV